MTAEIITIGDEILIGQIVDTNSAWLGEQLGFMGIKVGRITSVQDDRKEILDSFDSAFSRSDLIIVTGGLGPTKDDITKHTLAEYFGCPLEVHQPTFDHLKNMMEARGMEFNELNRHQADVPRCCRVIPNNNGTAPGMWFERDGKILVSMPGVPFEMKAIFSEELAPRLREYFKLKSIIHKTAVVFGLPESMLAIRLEEWENALPPYIKLAYLPNPRGIRLRLSSYEVDHDEGMEEINRRFGELRKIIPQYFLGFGDTTLEKVVADILRSNNETLSVAESCSGGTIATRFVAMPGASEYFLGGVVSYSNEMKVKLLGVNAGDLEKYGAVSSQIAEQMADGVRKITGSTYSISTTGIAGPDGGTPDKPVGTVWMAISTPKGTFSRMRSFGRLRDENIKRTTANAIDMLRLFLTGYE